jgi:nucleotide-binding universal stress UspA family protein
MFALPRILLPVDFSERSIDAAQYATALAARLHSAIHLIHVVDLRVYGVYGLADDASPHPAQEQMDGFLADSLRGFTVKRTLLYGDPAREIVKYAESENIEMIILPTHGYGPFRQLLLGSVTAKVLHDAHCPVWTGVHAEGAATPKPVRFNRVLCALDPSNGDYRALAWAWDFAAKMGGQVRIVHCLPPIPAPDTAGQAKEEIRKAQENIGSSAEVQLLAGEVAEAVHAAAKEWDADLTVISRGVASGLLGRLRTRTYSIIRESPCPVVSV